MQDKNKSFYISILLLLSIILSACGIDKNVLQDTKDTMTEITDNSDEIVADNLPTEDFEGYMFRILVYDNMVDEFEAVTQDGDVINDAVYKRNLEIEERFNIKLTITPKGNDDYQATVTANCISGDDEYDLYQIYISAAASKFVPLGYFCDWNDVQYVSENLNNEWWNQNILKSLQLNGKNYLINGDIGYQTIGCTMCIVFNKSLFDKYGIEYPYQTVIDGKWTLDALEVIIKGKNVDLNSDGTYNINDDYYGFASSEWQAPIGLGISADLSTIIYEEGLPVLNFYNERTLAAYEKIYAIIVTNNSPLVAYTAVGVNLATGAFKDNRVLIISEGMNNIRKLRDMDLEFGIIPYPKYDEKQENYISPVDAGTCSAAIPITNKNLERTGLIVEALAEASTDTIITAFYDITLKTKTSRDEESHEMLNIIRETASFDPLYIYNFGGLGFAFKTWIQSKTSDISSKYKSMEASALKSIQTIIAMTKLEE